MPNHGSPSNIVDPTLRTFLTPFQIFYTSNLTIWLKKAFILGTTAGKPVLSIFPLFHEMNGWTKPKAMWGKWEASFQIQTASHHFYISMETWKTINRVFRMNFGKKKQQEQQRVNPSYNPFVSNPRILPLYFNLSSFQRSKTFHLPK